MCAWGCIYTNSPLRGPLEPAAGSLSYTYATVCSGGAEKANIDRSGIGRKRNENSGTDVPPLVHNSTAGGTLSLAAFCYTLLYIYILSLLCGCVFFCMPCVRES